MHDLRSIENTSKYLQQELQRDPYLKNFPPYARNAPLPSKPVSPALLVLDHCKLFNFY